VDGQQRRLSHKLDRPIWSALTTRQAGIAEQAGTAVRLKPDYGVFAAAADASAECRAALTGLRCCPEGLWFLEVDEVAPPPGLIVHHTAPCVQMVADHVDAPEPAFAVEPLGDADAPQMFALARLTEPGPFFEHTHRMGNFIGEFLIFKGSFAIAASFTAVAVIGLLVTAIVFIRAMQALFSGPLAESCGAFSDLLPREQVAIIPVTLLMFAIGLAPQFMFNIFNATIVQMARLFS